MALAQLLVEQNFPAISIHRAMTQEERYVAHSVEFLYASRHSSSEIIKIAVLDLRHLVKTLVQNCH